jgi:RHS repeat-associated protein
VAFLQFDKQHRIVTFLDKDKNALTKLHYVIDDMGFISTDPHYYNYPSSSPYAYCGNNPIMKTDPTGMDWFENSETGEVYWVKYANQNDIQWVNDNLYGGWTGGGEGQWNWLGADDMFGDTPENVINEATNGLGWNANTTVFSFDNQSQDFMKSQGYSFMPTKMLEAEVTGSTIPTYVQGRMVSNTNTARTQVITQGQYMPNNNNFNANVTRSTKDGWYDGIFVQTIIWDVNVSYQQKNTGSFFTQLFGGLGNFVRSGTNPNQESTNRYMKSNYPGGVLSPYIGGKR